MYICKKQNRNCQYNYNQNAYQCKKCVQEHLAECPLTCKDCRFGDGCTKRGKNHRRMRPCSEFKWD